MNGMALANEVIAVLAEAMEMGGRAEILSVNTPLIGGLPEFDSMAIVVVITSLEERFNITVEPDEIDEAIFESVGALTDFIQTKLDGA